MRVAIVTHPRKADAAMRQIANMKGFVQVAFPDLSFIRVRRGGNAENDLAYTVIRNKAYKNVTSMFKDEKTVRFGTTARTH